MNQVTNLKVDQVLGYFAAGTTAKKADVIDMAGYEGCMFIYEFGTLLETGTLACAINGNTVDATGGTLLAGAVTHTCTAADALLTQSAIVVDIYQPEPSTSRYLEAMVTPAVANAVLLGITAIRYGGKLKPELTTGLLASALVRSPAAAA
jgi:hypothetical protein